MRIKLREYVQVDLIKISLGNNSKSLRVLVRTFGCTHRHQMSGVYVPFLMTCYRIAFYVTKHYSFFAVKNTKKHRGRTHKR